MKFYLIIYFAFITQIIFSQSNFKRGFDNGFKNGYCFDDYGCIAPYPPIVPILSYSESYDNYNQGYNRGFSMGQIQKNSDTTRLNQPNNSNTWGVATIFPEQNLYHPDNNHLMNVYSQAQQNYQAAQNNQQQQQYQQQLYKQQQIINREKYYTKLSDEYDKKYNAPAARKKRHEDYMKLKNTYDHFKYKPNQIEDGWYNVDIIAANINGVIPEDPRSSYKHWVYVRDNRITHTTNSPDNWKNQDSTFSFIPKEQKESLKKYMIKNNINTYKSISESNYVTQGVAKIKFDFYFENENGEITNNEDRGWNVTECSVIFIDYMDLYEKKQISINLDKKPINNSNSKVKTPKSTNSKSKKITKEVKTTRTNEVF